MLRKLYFPGQAGRKLENNSHVQTVGAREAQLSRARGITELLACFFLPFLLHKFLKDASNKHII